MAIIKVLCAEDDRLMRLEMKEKMTAKGWEVIEAVDGKEALVKYKKYRPDIVVLDVNMPKRSGLEVLQLIRVNDLQTPVVIYSSLAEEKDLKIGLCQGAGLSGKELQCGSSIRTGGTVDWENCLFGDRFDG